MAKQQQTNYRLNAQQAIKAVRDLTAQVTRYNAVIATSTQQNRALNLSSRTTIARYQALNAAMRPVIQRFAGLATSAQNMGRTFTHINRVTRNSAASVQAFSASVRNANRNIQTLTNRLATYSQAIRQSTLDHQRESRVIARSISGLRTFNTEIRRITQSMQRKNRTLSSQTRAVQRDTRETQRLHRSIAEMAFSFQNVARIFAGLAIHRAILRFTQALLESIGTAKEWSKVISEIRTISDRAAVSTQQWENRLVALSNSFGIDVVESGEAAYQALSNQVVDAADAVGFLAQQARLSITAVASLSSTTAATTSVLNAFGLGIESTSRINSVLFKTVEEGRLRLEDLSNTLGRVNQLSNQLGISFIEQQAAITLLTKEGIRAEEAITLLRNVELKLLKPTERLSNIFQQYGFESGQALTQTLGLAGAMKLLANIAAEGSDETAEIAEIFGRMRAIVGGLSLTQGELNAEVEKFGDAGKKSAQAFEERLDSLDKRADVQLEKLKNLFVVKFGKPVIQAVVDLSEALGGADKAIGGLIAGLTRIIGALAGYRLAVILATAASRSFFITVATGRATLLTYIQAAARLRDTVILLRRAFVGFAVFAAVDSIISAVTAMRRLKTEIQQIGTTVRSEFSRLGEENVQRFRNEIDNLTNSIERMVTNSVRSFRAFSANLRAVNTIIVQDFTNRWNQIAQVITNSMTAAVTAAGQQINKLAQQAQNTLQQLQGRRGGVAVARRQEIFDRAVKDVNDNPRLNEEQKLLRLAEIRRRVEAAGQRAIAANNIDLFDELTRRADLLQQQITQRVEQIRQAAAQPVDIREVVPNVRIGQNGRPNIQFREEVVGQRPQDAARAQQAVRALNVLEEHRRDVVQERIRAEEAFIVRQQAVAQAQAAEAAKQQAALQQFQAILARLDATDIANAKPGDIGVFQREIAEADRLAQAAGIDNADRIGFLRRAGALEVQLRRKLAQDAANAEFEQADRGIKAIEERLRELQATRERLLQEFVQATTVDIPTNVAPIIAETGAALADGGRDIVTPQILDNVEKAFQNIQLAPTIEDQSKRTDAAVTAIEQAIARLEVLDARGGIVQGRRVAPERDGSQILATGRTVRETIKVFQDAITRLQQTSNKLTEAENATVNLKREFDKLNAAAANIPPGFSAIADAARDAASVRITNEVEFQRVLNETLRLLNNVRAAQEDLAPAGGAPAPPPRRRGGGLFQASGGKINPAYLAFGGSPRGTDRIPTFLSAGETVLNRQASATFGPLVSALNGLAPGLQQSSQTVNFGDINVSLPDGSSTDQVDSLISELQRRRRLGLINF